MKFLTWNIHGAVGTDGRYDPERIVRALLDINPDIAVLQEVDYRREGSHVLRDLIETSDYQVHRAPAMGRGRDWYGQVMLSRFAVKSFAIHDLSVLSFEPRKMMDGRIQSPHGIIRVFATHLGLNRAERAYQLRKIAEIVSSCEDRPRLIAGDLNEWLPRNGGYKKIFGGHEVRVSGPLRRTFPARLPMLALDRILTDSPSLIHSVERAKIPPHASDHLPLVAELSASAFATAD